MGVDAVRDIHSAPVIWYSSLPGAGCEIGRDHLMLTELKAALALAQYESFDRGMERGAIRLTDRLRHIPLVLDVQKEAERANLVGNYNIFLDGASGTGKSFTTASILYGMYTYGEHVFIIDVGGSYEQVCSVVREFRECQRQRQCEREQRVQREWRPPLMQSGRAMCRVNPDPVMQGRRGSPAVMRTRALMRPDTS